MYRSSQNSVRRLYPGCISVVKDHLQKSRTYADNNYQKGAGNAPENSYLSGLGNPDTMTEEISYSQKTLKELDEIKRKLDEAAENPEDKKQ